MRLRRLFDSRIAALPGPSRRLLLLAALHHGDDAALVQIFAGSAAQLALCEVAGLVTVHPDPQRLRFSHPLVRAAVVDQASDPERRAAHRRLADLARDRHVRDLADLSTGPAQARRLAAAAYLGANVTGSLAGASALLARARTADPDATGTLQMATAAAAHLLNTDGDVDTAHRMLLGALVPSPADPASPTSDLHLCPYCQQEFADADDLRHHLEVVVNNAVHMLMLVCAFGGREDLDTGADRHDQQGMVGAAGDRAGQPGGRRPGRVAG
ncbi:hypothetical protein [Nocardioides rubriscoriae]|uniref:hypothetical protein n=1 Tax=Nocardioides rubriscoriae TaxID=642762 RepID=UPI0011DF32BB|nr:hypothetical protein [Nocardioides rubriscoriae]